MVMNTGKKVVHSSNSLLSTVAWKIGDEVTYALEGSVFVGGAAIQWLRDEMKIIERASETETIARSLPDNGGVCSTGIYRTGSTSLGSVCKGCDPGNYAGNYACAFGAGCAGRDRFSGV